VLVNVIHRHVLSACLVAIASVAGRDLSDLVISSGLDIFCLGVYPGRRHSGRGDHASHKTPCHDRLAFFLFDDLIGHHIFAGLLSYQKSTPRSQTSLP
jgi:hypothetical protein